MGSEMCIRDSAQGRREEGGGEVSAPSRKGTLCSNENIILRTAYTHFSSTLHSSSPAGAAARALLPSARAHRVGAHRCTSHLGRRSTSHLSHSMRSPTLRRRAALGVGCAQLLSPPAAWPTTPNIASPKRCLVAGATGRTGQLVLAQLALAEYAAVAEIRSDASKSRLPRGIDTLTFDLTDEATAIPDLAGITDVIDAAGFKPTLIPEQDRALGCRAASCSCRRSA